MPNPVSWHTRCCATLFHNQLFYNVVGDGHAIRVVVIDDDVDFLWLTRLSLRLEHDITVIGEAQEGETGVALALREQPDIVVTDLTMPRIDGFEAAERIKRSRPTVKVLTVTALSLDSANAKKCIAAA